MFPFVRPAAAPAYCLALALLAIVAPGIGGAAQAQTVTLHLSTESIAEQGGSATVTATVSPASTTPFTVEVSAQAFVELNPENGRIELTSDRTLTFGANEAESTGTVTIAAIDNNGHTNQALGGVTVEVGGTVSGGTGVTGPEDVKLAIVEDDGLGNPGDRTRPELVKTSDGYGGTVSESRIVLTFNEPLKINRLDEHSFRYRVNGGRYLAPDSATISGSRVIVTLREPVEKGDAVRTRYKPPQVGAGGAVIGSADIFLGLAVQDLAGNPLYRINRINLRNDTKPRVKLALTPAEIGENGGKTRVTATVPEAQAAPFTVIVSISPADGVEMSSNAVLYFAANATTSSGDVTIAAIDNDAQGANPDLTVSGTVTGASDVLAPLDVTLTIQDDEAPPPQTGTPQETLARAWLARFGRTVAGHVTDAIAERLNGSGGSRVTLGGRPLPPGGTHKGAANGNPAAAQLDVLRHNGWERWQRPSGTGGARTLTDRELLLGSSFLLNLSDGEAAAKGRGLRWTAWGRAAASRFDGEADGYSLDGDVTTVTLGADAARGRWLGGLALAHSVGAGGYRAGIATAADRGNSSGKPESSVTSVHPYLRFQTSEHLSFWGGGHCCDAT